MAGWLTCHLFKVGQKPTAGCSVWTHTEQLKLPVGGHKRLQSKNAFHLPVRYAIKSEHLFLESEESHKLNHWITLHGYLLKLLSFSGSGKSIICAGHNTTLQCASGQVLMIDGGFYGRRNAHYCRSRFSAPTFAHGECGWVDVGDPVKGNTQPVGSEWIHEMDVNRILIPVWT